jgi:hypothetical protein
MRPAPWLIVTFAVAVGLVGSAACRTSRPETEAPENAGALNPDAALPDKPSSKKGVIVPSDVPASGTAPGLPPPSPHAPSGVGQGPFGS